MLVQTQPVKRYIDPKTLRVPGSKAPTPEVDTGEISTSTKHQGSELPSPLLTALWRSPNRYHQIGVLDRLTKKFSNIAVKDASEAANHVQSQSGSGSDIYFACAEYLTSDNRTAANVSGSFGFWMDFDCGVEKDAAGKGYLTVGDAENAIRGFCNDTEICAPTHIVNSGSGLHVYWLLNNAVDRESWQKSAKKLKAITEATALLVDGSRTADIASVLRIPGTLNNKYNPPLPVILKHASLELIKQESMMNAIDKAYEKYCCQPSIISKSEYGSPDLVKLESALALLDPDCDEATWKLKRLAPLARAAWEHPNLSTQLYQLAKIWSSGELGGKPSNAWITPGKNDGVTGELAFEQQWKRFSNDNYAGNSITLGTIYHDAGLIGWVDPNTKLDALRTIQLMYALILLGGKFYMLDKKRLEPVAGQPALKLELSPRPDATLLIKRAVKAEFQKADETKIAAEFFLSPGTDCYKGVEFNPTGVSKGFLNLWVGPTLKPKPGAWLLMESFLRDVICDGNENSYQYVIRYIAHALQRPQEKPGVMLILLGGQGIGKGTFARILQKIWSATYLHVTNIDAVTGTFNASLERSFIVVMDEALFAGDRRASDTLKSLVTEALIQINEKHQPSRQIESFHRFIATTNADHFKNTESDDRRDVVLRVSETYKSDHAYWEALSDEIENGGVMAMLHDLYAVDLSKFNVRAKPDTNELLEQKLLSLQPIERWWHDCLDRGEFKNGDFHSVYQEEAGGEWTDFLSTDEAIKGVMEIAGGRIFRKPNANEVIKVLMKICPSINKGQKKVGNVRRRGLVLPSLQQARIEFEKYIGGAVNWLEDEI